MAKIRFELNIDEVIECANVFPNNSADIFKGDNAKGKTFLFVDKLNGYMEACTCIKEISDNNSYAQTERFPIPHNAVIIDEGVQEEPSIEKLLDASHKELMNRVQFCCDELNKKLNENYNDMATLIGQEFDTLKKDGVGGNSISESTLLKALEIVTNNEK